MKTNSKLFTLATLVAVSLTGATLSAQADEAGRDVPARTVKYADLNLNTQAGAAALYARIRNAAGQVCNLDDSKDPGRVVVAQACVDQAIMASVKAVDNAKLTNVYNAHGGVQPTLISVASVK